MAEILPICWPLCIVTINGVFKNMKGATQKEIKYKKTSDTAPVYVTKMVKSNTQQNNI